MYIHEAETLEQYESDMAPRWQEYCERIWGVSCDCGEVAFETQETLERLGWQLRDATICPKCGRAWQ